MNVHPTAVVAKDAQLEKGVEVGPYSVIGPHVKIGRGTKIYSHVVIDGWTTIGERCEIYPGSCLGMPPQDKKFKSQKTPLRIGNENVLREHVTIHVGTDPERGTVLGDRNFLMGGAHVGHDCHIGSDAVMANYAALGGFVVLEDKVFIGGLTGVHQFSRVGKLAMVGAKSRIVMDVPPFSTYAGFQARFFGVNAVGLRRAGYSSREIVELKKALKILCASRLGLEEALSRLKKEFGGNGDIEYLIHFAQESKRGLARSRTAPRTGSKETVGTTY